MSNTLPEVASRTKIDKFRKYLENVTNLEERDANGRTGLFRASRLGRKEHLELLIQRGADVNATDATGEAPLQAAARYGHVECATLLLDGGARLNYCPPPELTEYSESALCSAARKAPQLVKFLLSRGADPNAASSARRLPLIAAAENENNSEIVKALIDAGAQVNGQDNRGRTALHAAIDAGSVAMIKLLLAHGADPEVEAKPCGNALCAAILNLEFPPALLVEALLSSRPNLAAVFPSWDRTPIELAIRFELKDVEKLLIEAGSPPPRKQYDCDESDDDDSDDDTIIEPNEEDIKVAEAVCNEVPHLRQCFGWKASPTHWLALGALARTDKPMPLTRIAYFVRGGFNAHFGKELDDGPQFFGESYQEAMSRFINEGLVTMLSDEESIPLSCSTSNLKSLALKHGINKTGTREELARRLIEYLGIAFVSAALTPAPHFLLTDAGQAILADKDLHLAEAKRTLQHDLLATLKAGDFMRSCQIARNLRFLAARNPRLTYRLSTAQMADQIAMARRTLAKELSPQLRHLASAEQQLRYIAVAVSLIGDSCNDWNEWDSSLDPVKHSDGDPLSPTGFRKELLFPYELYDD